METNLIGELNMMKGTGIRPNFSEVARRYGVDRHTVAKYWNGGGAQPADGRAARESGCPHWRQKDLKLRMLQLGHITPSAGMPHSGQSMSSGRIGAPQKVQ